MQEIPNQILAVRKMVRNFFVVVPIPWGVMPAREAMMAGPVKMGSIRRMGQVGEGLPTLDAPLVVEGPAISAIIRWPMGPTVYDLPLTPPIVTLFRPAQTASPWRMASDAGVWRIDASAGRFPSAWAASVASGAVAIAAGGEPAIGKGMRGMSSGGADRAAASGIAKNSDAEPDVGSVLRDVLRTLTKEIKRLAEDHPVVSAVHALQDLFERGGDVGPTLRRLCNALEEAPSETISQGVRKTLARQYERILQEGSARVAVPPRNVPVSPKSAPAPPVQRTTEKSRSAPALARANAMAEAAQKTGTRMTMHAFELQVLKDNGSILRSTVRQRYTYLRNAMTPTDRSQLDRAMEEATGRTGGPTNGGPKMPQRTHLSLAEQAAETTTRTEEPLGVAAFEAYVMAPLRRLSNNIDVPKRYDQMRHNLSPANRARLDAAMQRATGKTWSEANKTRTPEEVARLGRAKVLAENVRRNGHITVETFRRTVLQSNAVSAECVRVAYAKWRARRPPELQAQLDGFEAQATGWRRGQ